VQLADPVGYVQAFDTRTGKRCCWSFSVIPQSPKDPGAETWENESWRRNGHGNVWAPMALDEARGLLYLPTSTPSSDYYGGGRPGAYLFAESLVCLDAATGKIKWYFPDGPSRTVDYDNPASPNLVTITVDGRRINAVAQVTKQGFTYVFDRVTGEPVWPIVEHPVATDSDVPGEKPYPTQPIPSKPPAFTDQGVSLDDAEQPHAGDQRDGARADAALSHRPALHASLSARHAAATGTGWRRRTGAARRSIRSSVT
jgi:quinoprotein glucose dehydrogenase